MTAVGLKNSNGTGEWTWGGAIAEDQCTKLPHPFPSFLTNHLLFLKMFSFTYLRSRDICSFSSFSKCPRQLGVGQDWSCDLETQSGFATQVAKAQLLELSPLSPSVCISKQLESGAQAAVVPRYSMWNACVITSIITTRQNAYPLSYFLMTDSWCLAFPDLLTLVFLLQIHCICSPCVIFP